MKKAILLHGKPGKDEYYDVNVPSASNHHWFPWLQKQLMTRNIKADTPEIPHAYNPQWDLWVKEVERFEITPETLIVGHSCGGGFWVRYLSERKDLRVGKVILVAPSLGYKGWGDSFFNNFIMDEALVSRTAGMTIFGSDNDDDSIARAIQEIRDNIPNIYYKEFHLGHFTQEDLGTDAFDDLLEACTVVYLVFVQFRYI